MSELEKLLEDVTVEWKPLGKVAEYVRGLIYNKSNESGNNTGYKVIRANNITLARHTINFNDIKYIKSDTKVKESQKLFKNDILISAASGSREHVGKVAYIFSDLDYYFGGFMGVIRCFEQINPRFLFHILTSGLFQKYLDEMLNSSTINNLSSSIMNAFQIPIPCPKDRKKSLEIQQKIVNILDKFTEFTAELTTELTAELIARKQQYKYYRVKLLSFKDGEVEWMSLGKVCISISAGGDVPQNSIKGQLNPSKEFPYPIFANAVGAKGLYGYSDEYKVDSEAVTISARGAKVGYHTVREGKFTAIIRLIVLVPDKSIISTRYLNYILEMTPIGGTKGGIPQLTVPTVKKIKIPIPSLKTQNEIVSILDKFDILTNSISEGLPREIELRQKQYEYYRDLLLTFPKDNVET